MTIELIILSAALTLIAGVGMSKVSERFGIPVLLLFLGLGMVAGSEGPGGIYFDNAQWAQALGTIALAFILFAGGLDTDVQSIARVIKPALALSTVGVLITAVVTGVCVKFALDFSWLTSFLIGSIVSSTDAAAVFAVLRSKNVGLKEPLRPLLELESGSNDPMAVFLTMGFIELIRHPGQSVWTLIPLFFQQMLIGLAVGYLLGMAFIQIVNRIKLDFEGLYPVLCVAWVLLVYGLTAALRGSGFLAVYIAGLLLSARSFSHKKSLVRFQDGVAWLMQSFMFFTLGLLVFPSELAAVAGQGLFLSLVVMLVSRPAAVFLSLLFSRLAIREKHLISWVGLRGSVPIVLATFPLLAGLDANHSIFNLIFFTVLTSVLFQGTTIPPFARLTGVDEPFIKHRRYPIDFEKSEELDMQLVDLFVPYGSAVAGEPILNLGFPKESLITLISRGEKYIMPSGATVLQEGDVLLILGNRESLAAAQALLEKPKEKPKPSSAA